MLVNVDNFELFAERKIYPAENVKIDRNRFASLQDCRNCFHKAGKQYLLGNLFSKFR